MDYLFIKIADIILNFKSMLQTAKKLSAIRDEIDPMETSGIYRIEDSKNNKTNTTLA